MRLVESSDPGEVSRADGRRLLCERLALASAVCHALEESGGQLVSETSSAALGLLRGWVREHFPTDGPETLADDGLDQMHVPPGDETLYDRLSAATYVCGRLAWLYTADTSSEFERDSGELEAALEWWRRRNAGLLPPPHRPARTKIQRLALGYADGTVDLAYVVTELIEGRSESEPPPWRRDMDHWTGVCYLQSAGLLTLDQLGTINEAYSTAVLASPDGPEPS